MARCFIKFHLFAGVLTIIKTLHTLQYQSILSMPLFKYSTAVLYDDTKYVLF